MAEEAPLSADSCARDQPADDASRSLRILVASLDARRGGVARSVTRIAAGLRALGHDVHVCTPDYALFPGDRREDAGSTRFGPGATDRLWDDLADVLTGVGQRMRADVVIGFYLSGPGAAAARAATRLGAACVVSARGNDLDLDAGLPERAPLVHEALRGADRVTVVSRAHARLLRDAHGLEARFVPNAVDVARFRPNPAGAESLRRAMGLGRGPIVGIFGELKRKRGVEHLASSRILGERARLLVVGSARADVRALVPSHATLVPWVDDDETLAALYALCDVVVHPSTDDGMPNVVLEAMACARPVVVSRAGGLIDLVEDGVNGFVVDATRSLDDAIVRALENPTVGARARASVPKPEDEARAYVACAEEAMRRYAARSASRCASRE